MTSPTPQRTRVAIACDHAGVETRDQLAEHLRSLSYDVLDLGPQSTRSVDYPSFARDLCHAVTRGDAAWGVLICGTGIGMSIAANRVPGARAALVHDEFTTRMAREHNDANVVVVGARVLDLETMKKLVALFGRTEFTPGDDGRHLRRVRAIDAE